MGGEGAVKVLFLLLVLWWCCCWWCAGTDGKGGGWVRGETLVGGLGREKVVGGDGGGEGKGGGRGGNAVL